MKPVLHTILLELRRKTFQAVTSNPLWTQGMEEGSQTAEL